MLIYDKYSCNNSIIIYFILGNGSYSNELTKVLITDEYDTWKATLKSWNILEKEIIYNKNGTSFTYLLLDPRITRNLPSRADQINDPIEIWQTFISSIFYIGKGTKSRPNDHMNEAFSSWIETNNKEKSEKVCSLDLFKKKCLESIIIFSDQVYFKLVERRIGRSLCSSFSSFGS